MNENTCWTILVCVVAICFTVYACVAMYNEPKPCSQMVPLPPLEGVI